MKARSIRIMSGLVILLLIAGSIFYYYKTGRPEEVIYIAAIGPFKGADEKVGRAFKQGLNLALKETNQKGGINGRKLRYDLLNDQNDHILAMEMAQKVIKKNRAIAVIGHHYSSCSISAGPIYKKYKIPAITPFSTNAKVTQDNEWYFRNIYNDDLQARFLASYAKKIDLISHSDEKFVSIIHENLDYGQGLADSFEKAARSMGLSVKYRAGFDPDDTRLDQTLRSIVSNLQSKKDAGSVFIATHAEMGVRIVKIMRDSLMFNPVMTPDAFASHSFSTGFDMFEKERRNPGFYTNGIYVTSPLIFDTAGKKAQLFKADYFETYGEKPDWIAAFAYDTAMLVIDAAKNTAITGQQDTIASDRENIRDYLAGLDSIDNSLEGVTGFNYFDANRNSLKPITIGIYKNINIISALIQFHPVGDLNEVPDFKKALSDRRIMLFGGRYMYKTNVVYTGIRINRISDLDLKSQTCNLDFNIWFRFQGNIDVENIEFLNAVDKIEIGQPVDEQVKGNITSRLFLVKGRFKTDFVNLHFPFNYHILGFRFRHRELPRHNLVYVADILGMGMKNYESFTEKMKLNQVLSSEYGWSIVTARFVQDVTEKDTMGNLDFILSLTRYADYSRFNFGILIKKSHFSLRGEISEEIAPYGMAICTFMVVILFFIQKSNLPLMRFRHSLKVTWLMLTFFFLAMLLCSETLSVTLLFDKTDERYQELSNLIFDILWWIVPAVLLNSGMKYFVWIPIKDRTGRAAPNVLRGFVAYIIFFLAFYGIVVFVFEQNINKLMATSGVIAMIIGFVIKANISNFFSGITINQGNAVRIGDWVQIGGFDPGRVYDITWRSTKLEVGDGSMLSVPNAVVSDSIIHNYNYPKKNHAISFSVHVHHEQPPDRIIKILYDAVISAQNIVKEPEPIVRFKGLTEWSSQYGISFEIEDYAQRFAVEESVWKRIWTHLQIAGIEAAVKHHEMRVYEGKTKAVSKIPDPFTAVQTLDIFKDLSLNAHQYLSKRVRIRKFAVGEIIVEQGDMDNSLFVIVEGVVNVVIHFSAENEKVDIVRIGAGSFFGEMALLTGEPRNATIVALTDTCLFEITKEDIAPLIEQEPEISNLLSTVLSERKTQTDTIMKMSSPDVEVMDKDTLSLNILYRIQNFFGLKKKNDAKNDQAK